MHGLFFLITSVIAIDWLLNPANYMTTINQKLVVEFGIMWGGAYKLNHETREDLPDFSFLYADPGKFYMQQITDKENYIELTQKFRIGDNSWIMELEGEPIARSAYDKEGKFINLVFYVSTKHGSISKQGEKWSVNGIEFEIKANSEESYISYIKGAKVENLDDKLWKVKRFAQKWLLDSFNSQKRADAFGILDNNVADGSNLLFFQFIIKSPFDVTISYGNTEIPPFEKFVENFREKFKAKFGEPINEDFEYSTLSMLLSGLSLFSGPIIVQSPNGVERKMNNTLLSFVPSKTFFPRGFLWDEGFHLQVACNWNSKLCEEVIISWLNTMDDRGWIPREQIRGPLSESRVPEAFLSQNMDIGNPPTLLFSIENLSKALMYSSKDNLEGNEKARFLKTIYHQLKKWLAWLSVSQLNEEGYFMWKGRTLDHNLASGLDDYPRALLVNSKERHLDLHSWITYFTRCMYKISGYLYYDEDREIYSKKLQKLESQLDELFWDGKKHSDYSGVQFIDQQGKSPYYWRGDNKCGDQNPSPLGGPSDCNPYSDSPCCSEFGWCGNTQGHCSCPKCKKAKKLEDRPELSKKKTFSPHIGYVNLLPFCMGILKKDSPGYKEVIRIIKSPNELWTQYGLRSLSKSDMLYGTGENYWRGPIWINFNYLVLRGIKLYYWDDEELKQFYENLKENIVKTVVGNWKENGFLWEQYSDVTGKGQRVHPFAGWTTLILNIMHDIY